MFRRDIQKDVVSIVNIGSDNVIVAGDTGS
jgi:hypothetical protein